MTAIQMLATASTLPAKTVDLMAHALGWPLTGTCSTGRAGRVKWANPYRNHYAADTLTPAMQELLTQGLIESTRAPYTSGYHVWRVTKRGQLVTRLRLQSETFASLESR